MSGLTAAIDAAAILAAVPLGWTAHVAARALIAGDAARPPPAPYMIGAAMGMAAIATATATAPGVALLPGVLLGWGLLVLAAVDLAALRLPDVLTLPLVAAGLGLAAAGLFGQATGPGFELGTFLNHTVGAAAGYGVLAALALVFRRLRGHDGLGLGDAKLAAVAGAWLGGLALPMTVLIACALAFGWIGVRVLRRGRSSLREPLPFGPPLAAAIWIVWVAADAGGWAARAR